ncbi:DUF1482 family protein [Enterobacter sp. RHBSTW-00994]|uniref:DUF1482 family protein n=1 Tax=Enterobacter sp. RHBSTW-00994 TaxID=2742676 RepID=UPI0015EAEBD2|nr:DUF1482 family protein [Enterobacter sp. RHBSTW-00994]QLR43715.1 DUF1482 family protein [Enterobacter sp. RHBSTW-00994]
MSTLFALVISVCALTGECSDIMLGVYKTEAICDAAAVEQHVKGQCLPFKSADDQQPAVKF